MAAMTSSTVTRAAAGRPSLRRRAARRSGLTTRASTGGPSEEEPAKKSLVAKAVDKRVTPEAATLVLAKLKEEAEVSGGGDLAALVKPFLLNSAKLDALTTLPSVALDFAFLYTVNSALEQLGQSGAEGWGANVAALFLGLGQFNFQFGIFQGVGKFALNLGTSALWAANPEAFVAAIEERAAESEAAPAEAETPAVKQGPTLETLAAAGETAFALRDAMVSAAGDAAGMAGQGSLDRLRMYEVLSGLGDREAYGLDKAGANELAAAFLRLDKDGNGFVDRREWELAVSAQTDASLENRDEVIAAAFGMVDANNDGRLSVDEFAALWTLSTPMRTAA